MIKPFSLHKLIHEHEFVPQALIAEPLDELVKRFGSEIEKGSDDFDTYVGAGGLLDERVPFALMHYGGHPKGTSTIYLPFEYNDVENIMKIIYLIVSELKIPDAYIKWQRKDGVNFKDS